MPSTARRWEYILNTHGGKLPIIIKAVPEGVTVPVKNVLMTVVNTDPKCYWLTNYLETLLVQVWYPMTVATQSREQKKVIVDYLEKTGCGTDFLDVMWRHALRRTATAAACRRLPPPAAARRRRSQAHLLRRRRFSLNDFGCRGVSSMETAAIGGAAHLVNFGGSDTMPGLCMLYEYYGLKLEHCIGTSIPAAEHSTITSWGKDGELEAFKNMLTQYPKGLVAVVSDSYDIYNACKNLWGTELIELIKGREGRLVVRPDSGDPPVIVCEVLEILMEKFGCTTTSTGHKLLPPQIRVIQGDGVSYETLSTILAAMEAKGYAAGNVAFGSGGALLQKLNRDTQKCAFKCCEAIVNGEARNVFKVWHPLAAKPKSPPPSLTHIPWAKAHGAHNSAAASAHVARAAEPTDVARARAPSRRPGRHDARHTGPDHRQGQAVEEGAAEAGQGRRQLQDPHGGRGQARGRRPRHGTRRSSSPRTPPKAHLPGPRYWRRPPARPPARPPGRAPAMTTKCAHPLTRSWSPAGRSSRMACSPRSGPSTTFQPPRPSTTRRAWPRAL